MIVERDVDCAALYEASRVELLELVRSLSAPGRATPVPATPLWSVQDVVAHVVGITADLRTANYGPGDQDAWTAAQVQSRRGHSIDDLAAEWDAEAPGFEDGLRLFGYEMGSHFLGDLLQHIADVRHALGLPRIPDDETLLVALDFYLDSFHHDLTAAGVGSVTVRPGEAEWTLGEGDVVATWAADRYDVLRALGGRRSAPQILAGTWTGAAELIVPLVSRYGLPATGLVEP